MRQCVILNTENNLRNPLSLLPHILFVDHSFLLLQSHCLHVRDAPWPVEFCLHDVIYHSTRVPDPKTTRLDPTHRGRPDDTYAQLIGSLDHCTSLQLRNLVLVGLVVMVRGRGREGE